MKTAVLLAVAFVLIRATTALAHPGWGIVQDSRGSVYFTDTRQVWKVTPEGMVSVVVAEVHTHELYIDANDNLFGEHLWYEGDATQKWGHRVWRRRPNGTVTDVVPARGGFRTDYSFVRDGRGNMYWADRTKQATIKKRTPGGAVTTWATGPFRSVEKMTALMDGTLYLIDAGDLRRVSSQGVVSTVVRQLTGTEGATSEVGQLNYHMGLWTDRAGHVYVAAAAERSVLRVDSKGSVSVVDRSATPWSPSGGMIDHDGNLWVLEYDDHNRVRTRRIDRAGQERVFPAEQSR